MSVGVGVGVAVGVGVSVGGLVRSGGGVFDADEPQAEFESTIETARPAMTRKATGIMVRATLKRSVMYLRSLL
jgi:hypothetical protein